MVSDAGLRVDQDSRLTDEWDFRYFERSNGYIRLKDTNWVLFWHGSKGFNYIDEYASIVHKVPASFSGPLPKKQLR